MKTVKLTEREKECLRLWLDHKTAKEIARELGISHHAVEKRLKTARTKLGVASSLEAARLLAREEGYGQTAVRSAELQTTQNSRKPWQHPHIGIGGIVMSLVTLMSVAFFVSNPATKPVDIEIDRNHEQLFDQLDENDSGYLENPESPFVTMAFLEEDDLQDDNRSAILGDETGPQQIAEFYAGADTNGDKRVSLTEYSNWSDARLAKMGIKIKTVIEVEPLPQS